MTWTFLIHSIFRTFRTTWGSYDYDVTHKLLCRIILHGVFSNLSSSIMSSFILILCNGKSQVAATVFDVSLKLKQVMCPYWIWVWLQSVRSGDSTPWRWQVRRSCTGRLSRRSPCASSSGGTHSSVRSKKSIRIRLNIFGKIGNHGPKEEIIARRIGV